GLPGLLPSQAPRREPAQLLTDERQQMLSRLGVALLDGFENEGHIVHRRGPPMRWRRNRLIRSPVIRTASERSLKLGRLDLQIIRRYREEIVRPCSRPTSLYRGYFA